MTSSVYIAKTVYGGDGLGRLGDGRVIFVPGAFAGEQVKAEIIEEKKNFVKGRLVEVVTASPERETPPSLVVPGMVYAALTERGEQEAKESQLRDFFERARLATANFLPTVAPTRFLNYRNKVVYHFARQNGKWVLGYREEPSHTVRDITEDPLARPEINAQLPEIRSRAFALLTQGAANVRRTVEREANLTIRWSEVSGVRWWIGSAPREATLKERTLKRIFEVPAGGFYQVNPEVGEQLVGAVTQEYQARAAVAPAVIDLYCGVGVFGLSCHPPKLIGIESGREAVAFAKRNAALQRQENAEFIVGQIEHLKSRLPKADAATIILDPPRGGLAHGVADALLRLKAPYIFYVSCDPATLMRDLKRLTLEYDVESVRWFNMFPRTARFESFVILKRRAWA